MIEESTAAIKVAVQWLVTPFRFAAGYLRIFWRAASLWLPRRMGFDILMALSGIDALGWGYRAKAVRTGPVAAKNRGKPLGPGSEVIR